MYSVDSLSKQALGEFLLPVLVVQFKHGTHILLMFQDVRPGSESENKLYYIPLEQLGTEIEFTPIRLPRLFFKDLRENIQLALQPVVR